MKYHNCKNQLFNVTILITLLAKAFVGCTETFGIVESLQDKPVSISEITIDAPVFGEIPAKKVAETDEFTGTVSWSPTPANDRFSRATNYTAIIELTPKNGFTFSEVAFNSFEVTGATNVTRIKNSGVIVATFPATAATISINTISGVSLPVSRQKPAAEINTSQYTGTITWNPPISDEIFAPVTQYTAEIKLHPKNGYTLEEVPADFFFINGAIDVYYNKNEETIHATFPETRYAVGDTGPAGGIVFYDNNSNTNVWWRFLEAWTADEIGTYEWTDTDTITIGTSTAMGSGYTNTYTAMSGGHYRAAETAIFADHGEYRDWFLPSKDELKEMYLHREVIGGFDSQPYWSSSKSSRNMAWLQDFSDGHQFSWDKTVNYLVRVVRRF